MFKVGHCLTHNCLQVTINQFAKHTLLLCIMYIIIDKSFPPRVKPTPLITDSNTLIFFYHACTLTATGPWKLGLTVTIKQLVNMTSVIIII